MRIGDHVDRHQFAHAPRRRRARVRSRFHRAHVATHRHGDIARADKLFPGQHDIRRLHHCVGCFDSANETLGLDHTECFHAD